MAPFVPDGASRRDTAVLLVGTAEEFGVSQQSIRAVQGGFVISDELADVLYTEGASAPDAETSGNRAVKKNSKEES